MDTKIRKTITAIVPGNACNFNCSYCYNAQIDEHKKNILLKWKYPVKRMLRAFLP